MTQDHVLNHQKNPHVLDVGFPLFFGLQSLPSSVKESLLSNSQSKSYGRVKFWTVINFQAQCKQIYFRIDDVIFDGVIATFLSFEKMTYSVLMTQIVSES